MANKPELLAPAGSMEALIAGLNSGADAVYLGGKSFSARAFAANFDRPQIEEALNLAHRRGARVYVAVNTLVDNSELREAAGYLRFLNQVGTDAIIVQDLGLLNMARQLAPDLEIHASTQMTVHNEAGVRLLEGHGVQRVVLSRELSLENISLIKKSCGTELEVFIHGALCICYSGQCLMSSMIGGRSGNRGECAQPCRLPYTLVDREKGKKLTPESQYLLSTRDLCLAEHLPALIKAGISCFKVEGRMKRPEYVATVVRIYRRLLDRYLASPEEYHVTEEELKDLAQIFNRQFTTGYFFDNPGREMMGHQRPNNRGSFLGRITACDPSLKTMTISLAEPLRKGDGVEVWVTRGGRKGMKIHQIRVGGQVVEDAVAGQKVQLPMVEGAYPGDRVFKTFDEELMQKAYEALAIAPEDKKTPVAALVKAKIGDLLSVTFKDDEGHQGAGLTLSPVSHAKNQPLTREALQSLIGRLGNTQFYLKELQIQIEGNVMAPFSEINAARRSAVDALVADRKAFPPSGSFSEGKYALKLEQVLNPLKEVPQMRPSNRLPLLSVTVSDLPSLRAAIHAGADRVCFSGEHVRRKKTSEADLLKGAELCREKNRKIIMVTTRVWHESQRQHLVKELETAARLELDGVLIGNPGTIKLAATMGLDLPLFGDYSLNVFNDLAVQLLSKEGITGFTLSPELNMAQLERMACRKRYFLECIVHGALPLMVSEHCVLGASLGGGSPDACKGTCQEAKYGLLDRMQIIFPIEVDQNCRMYVYNSKDLCLVEHLPDFLRMGINSLRIIAHRETAPALASIVRVYREALNLLAGGQLDKNYLQQARKTLEQGSPGGVTKGHYFRGVL